jgi:hypothetical protein
MLKLEDNIKMDFRIGWGVWTEFVWLRIDTAGWLL